MRAPFLIQCMMLASVLNAGCGKADPSTSRRAANEVRVAAAADLKFALDEIITEFGKRHPDLIVKATYGSSGNFYAQLSSKAPFDVYLSADIEYPRKLIEQG